MCQKMYDAFLLSVDHAPFKNIRLHLPSCRKVRPHFSQNGSRATNFDPCLPRSRSTHMPKIKVLGQTDIHSQLTFFSKLSIFTRQFLFSLNLLYLRIEHIHDARTLKIRPLWHVLLHYSITRPSIKNLFDF